MFKVNNKDTRTGMGYTKHNKGLKINAVFSI